MKHCIFRIVLSQSDEENFNEVKQCFTSLPNIQQCTFSPARDHPLYQDYIEFSCSMDIEEEDIPGVLEAIAKGWDGDQDDCETDQLFGEIFHPSIYYILFQY